MTAGQLCYMSFGPQRSHRADKSWKYFENILSSGHGSVLEHANFNVLLYGCSRSFTHELVRHRAGFSPSQVSQRYVDGPKLRFVMRPEWQGDEELEERFFTRIVAAAKEYDFLAERLTKKHREKFGDALSKTEMRKAVNQAARACLPNETEAPTILTGNVRAWRHFFNMRGSLYAEPEIRAVAVRLLRILDNQHPIFFQDCEIQHDTLHGAHIVLKYPKV
jgi:thymidylate synthase (FAD)